MTHFPEHTDELALLRRGAKRHVVGALPATAAHGRQPLYSLVLTGEDGRVAIYSNINAHGHVVEVDGRSVYAGFFRLRDVFTPDPEHGPAWLAGLKPAYLTFPDGKRWRP